MVLTKKLNDKIYDIFYKNQPGFFYQDHPNDIHKLIAGLV